MQFYTFFFPMKEILVWLHVQMGNERLEKYPKDIAKDRNDRELHGNKRQLTVKIVWKSWLNYVKSDLY